MKPERLLRAILPDVLIDNFDIVNFDKSADRFDIYLDEKKVGQRIFRSVWKLGISCKF